ncbi:MAG: hypothetical protein F6J93_20800 [Oscillatoria sp. SIO1A7]|nr:hypothetical protein [Oscillatoria sp. SIO1A7]
MQIEDNTGKFTQAELEELVNFIGNDLLSDEFDLEWLGAIKIRDSGPSGWRGYWKFKEHLDLNNQIDGIVAVIVLNFYYVRPIKDTQKRLDRLKEVLAHEYGHHWTLSYLRVYQSLDVWRERMPNEYYRLRGLNDRDYARDYSKGWDRCDKEIIAEDYRSLFAPAPYNEEHQMGTSCGGTLELPSQEVKKYIENLNK